MYVLLLGLSNEILKYQDKIWFDVSDIIWYRCHDLQSQKTWSEC